MRIKNVLAAVVCFAMASAVFAQSAMSATKNPEFKSAADMKWMPISPENPEVKIADLWGDHTKGAYGALIKFPAGFMAPNHTHTGEARIVVLSGTFQQTPQGKPQVNTTAGGYVFQPGGTYVHATGCGKESECVIFVEGTKAFDLKPVAAEGKK
jgi:anti-sigma factor ChrR (cupin superfamily)